MAKTIVFIDGHPDIALESASAEAAFEMAHEDTWGLTKKECLWHMQSHGAYLCQAFYPSIKFIRALKKAGMDESAIEENKKGRNGKYYGGRKYAFSDTAFVLIYEKIEETIEDNRKEMSIEGFDHMLDRILAYAKGEYRETKLREILR
jgi:hypothetical protein